jgi:hypothetical protein
VKGIFNSPACVSCASRRAGTLEGARRCTSVKWSGDREADKRGIQDGGGDVCEECRMMI